jgi:methylmalonyl-CoA/ethylmalonyl-CoA epimerase
MIRKIAHIGVGVRDLDEAEKFYADILSMSVSDREQHGDLKASFLPVGDTSIELLQSTTPEGVISKFIAKRGEGVHHIAYEVDDIEKTLAHLESRGVQLIDKKPRPGAHNSRIAFINPKDSYGVLVELVEPQKK